MFVVSCWRVFEEIRANDNLRTKFLGAANQRRLFGSIMDRLSTSDSFGDFAPTSCYCSQGHDVTSVITQRFFNCVAKNFVRRVTNQANRHAEPTSKRRKIEKLKSTALVN
jgi:hypothetical protein